MSTLFPLSLLLVTGLALPAQAMPPVPQLLAQVSPTQTPTQTPTFPLPNPNSTANPDPVPPRRPTVDLPIDPTRQTTAPLSLPTQLGNGGLRIVGKWAAEPLALSPALVEISILGSLLPEPVFLISPFDGPMTTTAMLLIGPSAVDAAAPIEPDVPSSTDVGPTDIAGITPLTGGQIQNCQNQVRRVKHTESRDRNQAVYESLIQCYQQNLEVAIAVENTEWQIYSLNNLAVSYFVIGDYLQAIERHQQQLAAAQAQGDEVQEGIALSGLGAAHAALGDYATSIEFYTRSLPLLRLDAAPQWRALTLRNLGNAYYAQEDYETAQQYQQQSLELSGATGDRYGATQALGNLGNVYTVLADFPRAIAAYEQSLSLAKTLEDPLETAQALLGLGTAYATEKDYHKAQDYYRQSLSLVRQMGARLGEGLALSNLGDALYHLNQLVDAEKELLAGITVWESLRAGLGTHDNFKVSLFETQLSTYRTLQAVLIANNQVEKALEISERGRARAFVELLARGQQGDQIRGQVSSRINDIRAVTPPTIEQLKKVAIDNQSTLVEYTIVREQFTKTPHGAAVQTRNEPQETTLLIWVVQPSGQVTCRQVDLQTLPSGSTLAVLVTQARERNRISNRGFSNEFGSEGGSGFATTSLSGTAQLKQLYALLIAPIADLLPSDPNAPIMIVPQEELFLVPFVALQTSTGDYLIEHHTVLTAPSIQAVTLTDSTQSGLSPQALAHTLIVGNPTPMPEPLPALPYTEVEATQVAQMLGARPLVGTMATEAAVKAQLPSARLIHLATHGLFNEDQPMQGAIALSPGDQDGLLTATEIMDFSLNADLVVLSACDTGRGRITGDGVIGLARSFLAAGANSVLVSLWQVPDEATASLMVDFYRQLQTGDSKAQALRRAMLTTLETYPNPRDWAAFTVMGQAR